MRKRYCLAAVLLLAASLCPAQDYVDQVVERARKEFDVPGIAVAIVKDGEVVLAKGYGVRKLGEPAPVTAQSLFRIASNTKAFTTAALAMLVDERKIRWDDPVTQHMPAFQMYDPYVTREMTIRDLLTHRSGLGLGAGDLMFFPPSDLGRDEIVRRLRFIKPATSFRSAYAYDNLLYIVAGQLIPAVTGKSWDDFVRERIFTPLGMTNTFTDIRALTNGKDVAIPHNTLSGKLEALPQEDMDSSAPAGAIITCVDGSGEVDDRAVERRHVGDHAALNSRVVPNMPPFNCRFIHFARSATQVMMAPAGALLSMSSCGSASSLPESALCGVATSLPLVSAVTSVNVLVMPSGVKMRSRTKSSQLLPVIAGINCPATM